MSESGATPRLTVLPDHLAVCRLGPGSPIPEWAASGNFFSVTRTSGELSVLCSQGRVPTGIVREEGWRALGLEGPLDFSLVGVLASLLAPLAEAGVSVFAVSTYDTDYVLVKQSSLETVAMALRESGYEVRVAPPDIIVRPSIGEEEFLWEMLYAAVHWGSGEPGPKPPPEQLLAEPGLRRYLAGWGREGDFAVVAEDPRSGRKIGAAWYRLFPASAPGYGFVNATTPDIVIAVVPDRRGTGVGRALLQALMAAARSNGFGAISLSVQKSNHAATRLYEKNGFVRVSDGGDDWIMKAELSTELTANDAPGAQGTEKT